MMTSFTSFLWAMKLLAILLSLTESFVFFLGWMFCSAAAAGGGHSNGETAAVAFEGLQRLSAVQDCHKSCPDSKEESLCDEPNEPDAGSPITERWEQQEGDGAAPIASVRKVVRVI